VIAGLNADLIAQIYGHEDRLDVVVAVGAPTKNVQAKIDLGR